MDLPEDYRDMLKHALAVRRQRNPNYSLRAFARDLEISPSRLSEVLSQRQFLSRPTAEKIATRLKFSIEETAHFIKISIPQKAQKAQKSQAVILPPVAVSPTPN